MPGSLWGRCGTLAGATKDLGAGPVPAGGEGGGRCPPAGESRLRLGSPARRFSPGRSGTLLGGDRREGERGRASAPPQAGRSGGSLREAGPARAARVALPPRRGHALSRLCGSALRAGRPRAPRPLGLIEGARPRCAPGSCGLARADGAGARSSPKPGRRAAEVAQRGGGCARTMEGSPTPAPTRGATDRRRLPRPVCQQVLLLSRRCPILTSKPT